MSGYKKLVF